MFPLLLYSKHFSRYYWNIRDVFPVCILPGKVRHIISSGNTGISSLVAKNQLIYEYDDITVSRILVNTYKFTT